MGQDSQQLRPEAISSQDTGRATLLVDAALAYAKRGIKVFPVHSTDVAGNCSCAKPGCGSPGKHPRTAHGLHDASSDPQQIRTWWRRWPEANIAMDCGASERVVVDIDDKDGRPGPDSWSLAKQGLGAQVDDTTTVATPSVGMHVDHRADGHDIASGNDRLGRGVDIKAKGGYVLLPPSMVHGTRYVWVEGHGLDKTKPIPSRWRQDSSLPRRRPTTAAVRAGQIRHASPQVSATTPAMPAPCASAVSRTVPSRRPCSSATRNNVIRHVTVRKPGTRQSGKLGQIRPVIPRARPVWGRGPLRPQRLACLGRYRVFCRSPRSAPRTSVCCPGATSTHGWWA